MKIKINSEITPTDILKLFGIYYWSKEEKLEFAKLVAEIGKKL